MGATIGAYIFVIAFLALIGLGVYVQWKRYSAHTAHDPDGNPIDLDTEPAGEGEMSGDCEDCEENDPDHEGVDADENGNPVVT